MCNEMKLKQDVLLHIQTNKMVGFTEDFLCKKNILKNLLYDDRLENYCKPATTVCQWQYRVVNGRSYNCEFWYNAGSLNSDELLEQFNQVLIKYETFGSRVLGLVSDAGGSNACLFRLLRDKMALPEGGWLPIEAVRTVNLYPQSNRFIYLFHCVTRDLKAMRNTLYTSWWKDKNKTGLRRE